MSIIFPASFNSTVTCGAYWLPLSEAPGKLSYNGERQMAEKALQYIESHPDELT